MYVNYRETFIMIKASLFLHCVKISLFLFSFVWSREFETYKFSYFGYFAVIYFTYFDNILYSHLTLYLHLEITIYL